MADLASVGAVILAAGSSRRLGRPKQLLTLDGKPLLQHVIDAAAAAGAAEIIVVLGHESRRVAESITMPSNGRVVINPAHATGQASSLRTGIMALGAAVRRAVVLLGDQPRVDAHVIRAVGVANGAICRASYRGVPGHPVAFDRELWGDLTAIDGDRGARDLIAARPEPVTAIDVDAEPPGDVDTDDDAVRIGARG